MKIKIKRVMDYEPLIKYKDVLDKYHCEYFRDNDLNTEYGVIELNAIDEIFTLAKELGNLIHTSMSIVVDSKGSIIIYDDLIE